MKPDNTDTKDGTIGFSSQLGGNAKAGKTDTSGFGPQKTTSARHADNSDDQNDSKHPVTSAVARILPQNK